MQIHGLNKTTLLDYPEHVAATIFVGGCNFRCPFCHNGELAWMPSQQPVIAEEEVFDFLKKRKGILEGVCITGGEPTLQPDLEPFINEIRGMGYLVKLDTNGYRPEVLWHLLEEGLLDYVAMDIKSSQKEYSKVAGINLELSRIEESVAILKSSSIPYEFRTTLVKGLHTEPDIEEIGRWLQGCNAYYLQAYQYKENELTDRYEAFDLNSMEKFRQLARYYIDKVELRGVE